MASKTIKSFIWSFLEQGGSKAVQLIVQIVLARLLTPEAFGILAIILVVTNIADSIAQSGMGSALIQREKTDNGSYSTAFWMSLGIALVLFLFIQIGAPLAEAFYDMADLALYLRVLSVVVLINSFNSIQRSYLQKSLNFRSLFTSSLVAVVFSGVVGIVAACMGFGVWALVVQTLAQSLCMCVMMTLFVPWRPSFVFRTKEAKSLFSYGWKIAFTGVLNVFYTGISELIVGKSCSAEGLGYYSQGRKYPMAVINVFAGSIQNVLFPALAKKKDELESFRSAAKHALIIGNLVIMPVSLFCTAIAEPLISLLLTDKWLPCVPIFQMVCISHSVMMLTLVNLRAYMALGKSGLYLRLQIIKVTIGAFAICGTAIVTQDIYLTALATCLSTLFNTVVVDTLPSGRVYGYSIGKQLKDLISCLVVALVALVATLMIPYFLNGTIVILLVQTIVYWVVFLVLVIVIKVPGFHDACQMLVSMIKRKV